MVDAVFSLHNSFLQQLRPANDDQGKEEDEANIMRINVPNYDLAKANSILTSIRRCEVEDFVKEHNIFSEELFPVLETFLKSRILSGKQKLRYELEMFSQKGAMMRDRLIPAFEDKNEQFLEQLPPELAQRLLQELKDNYDEFLHIIENIVRWLSKSSVQFRDKNAAELPIFKMTETLHMQTQEVEQVFISSPTFKNLAIKYIISAWRTIYNRTTSIPPQFAEKLTQRQKDELQAMIPALEKHKHVVLEAWQKFNAEQLLTLEEVNLPLLEFLQYVVGEEDGEAAEEVPNFFPASITMSTSLAAYEFVSQLCA